MENNKEIGVGTMNSIRMFLSVATLILAAGVHAQPAVLPAKVDVSAIGAASYTIPIEVVPGTMGLQPNLSVTYNSMSGFGVLGSKWSLSGISAITRTCQTTFFDRNISPIGYDTADRFALDGNRMLLFDGSSYHGDNAVYCFELEDFSRITKVGTGNNFYFKRTLADGNVIEYGRTAQSKLSVGSDKHLSWMVDRVTDPNGNYMQYCYQQSDGEIWIERIDYTILSDGSPAYASVSFEYETEIHPNDGFVGGQRVRQSKRLKNIVAKYQGTQVRRYSFTYNTNLQYERLTKVALYDASNSLLSATTIDWIIPSSTMITNERLDGLAGSLYTIAGHFNDDKIYDVLVIAKEMRNALIMERTADGSFSSTQFLPFQFPLKNFDKTLLTITTCDINGDGIDEIIYLDLSKDAIYYYYIDVSDINNATPIPLLPAIASSQLLLGDFDGDGIMEPVTFQSDEKYMYYRFFESGTNIVRANLPTKYKYCHTGDFNGDGKTDLMFLEGLASHIYTYNTRIQSWEQIESDGFPNACQQLVVGDYNGDGMSDVLFLPNNETQWKLAIRKGTGSWTWPVQFIPELDGTHESDNDIRPKYIPIALDINGDGKCDILQPVDNNMVRYIISNGNYDEVLQYQGCGTFALESDQVFEIGRFSVGDLDGNGIADFLFSDYTSNGEHVSIKYLYKDQPPGYFVNRISNAANKQIKLEYSTISLMPNRFFGTGMNWMPLPLVKNLMVSNGLDGFDTTSFYYGDAQYDANRHQFIGFALFGTKNNNKISETFMSRVPKDGNTSFALLTPDSTVNFIAPSMVAMGNNPYRSCKSHIIPPTSNNLISKTINTKSSLYRTNATGNISFLPYASHSMEYNYLKNTKTIRQVTLRADNWRPSQQITRVGYIWGSSDEPSRQYINYTYVTKTLQNGVSMVKPSQIMTRNYNNASNSNPHRNTVSYTYTSSGQPSQKIHSDNGGMYETETYLYNGVGALVSATTTPRGAANSHSLSFVYDPTCRFVIRTSDHAGNVKQKTYDPATGLCLSAIDVNGLTTQYEYDSWGRPTKITYPGATTKTFLYTNASGGLNNVCCYTTVKESGKPQTRTYYDCLGRETHSYVAGLGYMDIVYNKLGQVTKQTLVPYNSTTATTSSKKWKTFQYDTIGRVVKESSNYQENIYSYWNVSSANSSHLSYERVENKLGAVSTQYYDAAGRVVKVVDDGGEVTYTYDRVSQNGKIYDRMRIATGGKTTTIVTDSRGNRLSLTDPDAGTTTCTYDVWSNLLSQTNAKGDVTTMTYDNQSRVVAKSYSQGGSTDAFAYNYGTTGTAKGKITSVLRNGASYQSFGYDAVGRLSSATKYIDGVGYTHQYTYNGKGQLFTTRYPSGYVLRHEYDANGRLEFLMDNATNTAIYTVDSRNTLGQPRRCWFGNNTGVEYTYDAWGLPIQIKYGHREVHVPFNDPLAHSEGDEIQGGGIIGPIIGDDPIVGPTYYVGSQYSVLQYSYNNNGYITRKRESKTGQREDFTYDILGRLTSVSVNGIHTSGYTYESNGNVKTNGHIGNTDYVYDPAKPHAVVQVVDERGALPTSQCDVTYNSRNRPATISENGWRMELSYGSGLQREKSVLKNGNTPVCTTYFISKDCEREIKPTFSRYTDYIYADGKIVALHIHNTTANADSLYYVQTDLLGSWVRIVDGNRNVVQSSHFDPWGNRMSAANWTQPLDGTNLAFRRGFTGHEHYDRFGIINMNARLYDPVLGRFFSPDPQVQSPFSSQGFNRYSYCGNNPVMYTDPNGEFFIIDSWILGFIHGFFSTGNNRWEAAWNTANRLAGNDLKLWGGLFITDPNKSFFGQVWEIVSRFTWQAPQTLAGFTLSQFANASEWIGFTNGGIQSIDYLYGATVVTYNVGGWGAVTLGNYINGENSLRANPNNSLFQHEYGHYIQSQTSGIFYLSRYGIPSGLNSIKWLRDLFGKDRLHKYHPVEQDANIRALKYFNNYINNFSDSGWNFKKNPILGYNSNLAFEDPQNQVALNRGLLGLAWYNYLLPGEIIFTGLINWLSLENYE